MEQDKAVETETVVEPIMPTAEGTPTPTESTETKEGDSTTTETSVESTTTEDEVEGKNGAPWAQKRIDQLTREKHTERRAREALEAELAVFKAGAEKPVVGGETTSGKGTFTLAEVDAIRKQEQETASFNLRCNAVFNEGNTAHEDFKKSLEGFTQLGGLQPAFIAATLETDAPAEVLYHLGKDLNKAMEIMELPPLKQVAALTKYAAEVTKPGATPGKVISKAPAPVKPIVGGGNAGEKALDDPNVSMDEFVRRRREADKARRQRA